MSVMTELIRMYNLGNVILSLFKKTLPLRDVTFQDPRFKTLTVILQFTSSLFR